MQFVGNTQLVAGGTGAIGQVLSLIEAAGIQSSGNPDVYVRSYAHFGVDDARDVRERAQLRAAHGRRVFVIATPTITVEAQNALLKTLEDAPGNSLFFLIVPNPQSLLGTIRSRAQMLAIDSAVDESEASAREFLRASPKDRLELLKPLLEKGDDERRDIGAIITLLSSLERLLSKEGARASHTSALRSIYRARKYIGDKGALVKPLLEQVALLVPSMKA